MGLKIGYVNCCSNIFSFTNVSQIMVIMMDNASNNDTMIESIQSQCHEAGIKFSAQKSCMHCMPHTIHLAAIKVCSITNFFGLDTGVNDFKYKQLLEGISIISKDNSAQAQATNYQDEVNVGVEHEYNMDTAQEMEGEDSDVVNERPSNDIQTAVYKVSEIVPTV